MTPAQKLTRARDQFRRLESICTRQTAPQWHESVYIADGMFVGRQFSGATLTAIWFTEEDVLKVFDADGQLHAKIVGEGEPTKSASENGSTRTAEGTRDRRAA
ncbi:MAG: hypothetical protein AAF745_03085 [Planctomycetota bacterium]